MICKKCNAIISEENAVYCHGCGARLDGKKACLSCGEFIEESHVYCVYCGARTDGKAACPACGTYHTGSFCPDCGTPLTGRKQSSPMERETECKKSISPEKKQRIWNTVFAWIRSGAGLACAVFALIFVFLVGFTLVATGDDSALSGLGLSIQTPNIFYFFGDVYQELADLKAEAIYKSEIPLSAGYVYAISGTVISAAMIGCVVGFATTSVVGFARFAVSGKENNGAKWGVGAALAFLGGSALLYALSALSVQMSATSSGVTVLVKILLGYNGATMAGVVLCIIFLAIYAAGNLVRKGAAWKEKKTIVNVVLAVVGVAFAVVAFAVGAGAFVGIEYTENGTMVGLSCAQYWNNILLVTFTEAMQGAEFYNEHLGMITLSCVFSFVQQFAAFAVVGCGVGFVLQAVLDTEAEQRKSGLCWAIPLVCVATLQFVAGIVGQAAFAQIFSEIGNAAGEKLEGGLQVGAGIVALVFSVLCLVVSIVKKVMQKPVPSAEAVEV